ncbi:MAG TPA: tail fiber domain-containing protein, partial [Chitinophagales bacterium]|nr:tail fiber domain-containing protein [Chitinophagales bacterium]
LGGTLATNTDVALNSRNLTFSGTGNVGVGNNAPQHQLSVGAATSDAQTVSIRGYSNLPGSWKGGGAFGYTSASVIMGELNGVAQMGGHSAALNAWATLSLNSGGGNVGVGTTTPAYKFDVSGDARATGNINAGTHLVIQYSDPYLRTDADNKHMVVSGGSGWTATGATMVLRGSSAGNNAHGLEMYTGNAERMRILSNGNMGIGTAAPADKLHVSTNIRADGTVYWGNGLVRTETRDNAGLRGDAGARSGFFETSTPTNYPAGATSWWHMIDVRHSNNANNYAMQIAGSFYDQNLWFRKTNDNAAQAWTRLLTTNDIPAGVLPAGAAGNTLYHNGSSWVSTSNLANDGSTITLGSFTNSNTDEWPKVQWLRVGTYDEGLIKGSSARGVWAREGFGIHMHSSKHFGFFSTGWDPLFDVEGGTGRTYIKGNTGIGVTNPGAKLDVAGNIRAISSTNPTVSAGSTSVDAMLFDGSGNYRPAVIARGTYPHIELWSDVSNANHGPTLRFGGYDNGSSGAYKHWVIGTAGSNLYFLDIGYQANSGNPHEGISGYGGPTIMRLTNSGNVGIGNFGTFGGLGRTTPDTRLEVASPSGNIATAVLHSSGGQAWGNTLTVATDGAGDNPRINFSYRNKAKHWQIGGYNADTRFSIWEDGGDGVYGSGWGTERITVAAGGNVGVGINTPNAKLDVSTGADGIAMGQIHGDNTNTIQTYIDGQWANRASYAGGCCNPLLIQPDVGTVGIGITGPAAKLHVVGNSQMGSIIAAAGNSYQTDWPGGWGGGLAGWDLCIASMRYSGLSQRSDERLKKDIKSLENMNALEIVDKMRPVSYGYRDERIARKLHYGFIAQEIQKILPEIVEVGTDSMQTLGMSYIDLIPILTQAVKEQQLQIAQLKNNAAQTTTVPQPQIEDLKSENQLLYQELKALKARIEELEKKK